MLLQAVNEWEYNYVNDFKIIIYSVPTSYYYNIRTFSFLNTREKFTIYLS